MIQKIDLNRYLFMGGKLENLILDRVRCTHPGCEDMKIMSIIPSGKSIEGPQMYRIRFINAHTAQYAGTWIETDVLLQLDHKYKKE